MRSESAHELEQPGPFQEQEGEGRLMKLEVKDQLRQIFALGARKATGQVSILCILSIVLLLRPSE